MLLKADGIFIPKGGEKKMKFYRVKWEYDQKPFPGRKDFYISNELFTQEEFKERNVNPEYVEEVDFKRGDTYMFFGTRFSSVLEVRRLKEFINTFRLEIWRNVRDNIDNEMSGDYICLALKSMICKELRKYNEFELSSFVERHHSSVIVETYFPELAKMREEATTSRKEKSNDGWFGRLSQESKKVRLSVVNRIINQLKDE